MTKQRRVFLGFAVLTAGAAALRGVFSGSAVGTAQAASTVYEVTHTDAEWHKLLTPKQYSVLRQAGTEYPFSSPLDHEKERRVCVCRLCVAAVFFADQV